MSSYGAPRLMGHIVFGVYCLMGHVVLGNNVLGHNVHGECRIGGISSWGIVSWGMSSDHPVNGRIKEKKNKNLFAI